MADPKERTEATKKRLADDEKARKAQAEQRDAMMGGVKPTPTQSENDAAAMGEHVLEHEPDGSPPDPGTNQPAPLSTRAMEGKPGGDYQTRAATPSPAPAQPPHK